MSAPSSPKDWLILQCHACGSPLKVRPESAAGTRVSCPVCRSPVVLDRAADMRSPEFRAELPKDSDRQLSEPTHRRPVEEPRREDEFIPGLEKQAAREAWEINGTFPAYDDGFLQNLKSTEGHHGGKHIKIKKRRKQSAAPSQRDALMDWDTTMDTLPEAELYSDPWLEPMPIPEEVTREKSRDFVVSEKSEEGQTVRRVKRVRKRRIFTLAQLFFRRLSYGMRVLTVSLVSAIGIGGMWWGIKVFRQRFMPVTFDAVVSDSQLDQEILERRNEDAATKVVSAFLAVTGVEAKLAHVRQPDRVRPLMETWYQKHPDKSVEAGEVLSRDKFKSGGAYFVKLELQVTAPDLLDEKVTRSEKRFFVVEETTEENGERSYKVDWETTAGWCEMTFDEFKLQQPRTPVTFRLKMRSSDYYNHGFTNEKKWLASELYFPYAEGGKERIFFGYLERGSKAWHDLALYAEPGNNASVIVSLRYPEDAVSREQVIIDSMVHNSWFYTEENPPAGKKKGSPP